MTELHPACEPLRLLLSTWQGEGHGDYPNIEPFGYLEEVTFGHVGKPFLTYSQKTRHRDTNQPLHAETGYWRVMPTAVSDTVSADEDSNRGGISKQSGKLEVVLSHPTGITEITEGTWQLAVEESDSQSLEIHLESTNIGLTATAKEVLQVVRTITATASTLHYTLDMVAVGIPLQRHLEATLIKSG